MPVSPIGSSLQRRAKAKTNHGVFTRPRLSVTGDEVSGLAGRAAFADDRQAAGTDVRRSVRCDRIERNADVRMIGDGAQPPNGWGRQSTGESAVGGIAGQLRAGIPAEKSLNAIECGGRFVAERKIAFAIADPEHIFL